MVSHMTITSWSHITVIVIISYNTKKNMKGSRMIILYNIVTIY